MNIKNFLILAMVLSLLSGCSAKKHYAIKASVSSTGGLGVVLYDFPISDKTTRYTNFDVNDGVIRVKPMIPGEYEGYALMPPFKGFEGDQLPDHILLKYQYATLSDCGIARQGPKFSPTTGKSQPGDTELYYTKRHCKTWRLLPDRIYTKKIDLSEANRSKEMRALGTKNRSGNQLGTELIFEFFDNGDVKVRAENTIHNRWN